MAVQSNEPKHEHLAGQRFTCLWCGKRACRACAWDHVHPRGAPGEPRRVLHLVERVPKHAVSE